MNCPWCVFKWRIPIVTVLIDPYHRCLFHIFNQATMDNHENGFDLEILGILENWSLRRGGRNRKFHFKTN